MTGASAAEAAIAFSKAAFPNGAAEVLLGRDDGFADSLASGSMQGGRPLLLTSTAALTPATDAELKRLQAKTVYVLGGPAAISEAVAAQLQQGGYTVRRLSGPTRIDTATAVARTIAPQAGSVIVARAFADGPDPTQAFADSLAAGGWSAATSRPIVLTETNQLSSATATYLQSAKPARAYVVGGTNAISDTTVAQIAALGIAVERVSGATRFHTAVQVNQRRGQDNAGDVAEVLLLDGQAATAWAPGFAAAAYSAAKSAPILLASGTTLPQVTISYLSFGSGSTALTCGPQLAAEACDAAAEALDKQPGADVTVNETSVVQYGSITGKVASAGLQSLTASGCGFADEAITVNQDGTFTARVTGAPGACTLTLTVTRDGNSSAKSFSLTVTEPGPATSAPELVKTEVASTGVSAGTVRFIFSEAVKETVYTATTGNQPAISGERFVLYGPRTTTAADDSLRIKGQNARRDPASNKAVLVDFPIAGFNNATTAAVERHAAEDVEGLWNPPQSQPLKALELPGARTQVEDLVSVGGATTQGAQSGKFLVPFTFDTTFAPEHLPATAQHYGVVMADGRFMTAETRTVSGATHTLQFDPQFVRTPQGTRCTTDCPTLQEALSGVRRGFVLSDTRRPVQAATVAGEGVTAGPDLTAVSLDVAANAASFTFDQTVDTTNIVAGRFELYTITGQRVEGATASRVSDQVIRVVFPSASKLVVGASVLNDAVSSGTRRNAVAAVALPQTFAPGELLAPTLKSGQAVMTGTDSVTNERIWEITWAFDAAVQTVNDLRLHLYTADGKRHGRDGGDAPNEARLTDCSQPDVTRVKCKIRFSSSAAKTPALAAADWRAADAAALVHGMRYQTIERSVRL